MRTLLPSIKTKADVAPITFLARLASAAAEVGYFELHQETAPEVEEGWDLVSFRVPDPGQPGLSGQLLLTPRASTHVLLNVRAQQWSPALNYETYVAAAHSVSDPLLRASNRTFKSRRRLHVETRTSLEPALPPGAERCFTRFVRYANKAALHPHDWKRFYQFIRHCHIHRVGAGESEIEHLLTKAGFDPEYAEYISSVFAHGRSMARIL